MGLLVSGGTTCRLVDRALQRVHGAACAMREVVSAVTKNADTGDGADRSRPGLNPARARTTNMDSGGATRRASPGNLD